MNTLYLHNNDTIIRFRTMSTQKTIPWQFFDASGNEHRCALAACQCQNGIPVMTGRDLVTFQWRFHVRCPQCGKEGDASPSPQQAVANWNAERGIRELDLKPGKEVAVSHPARAGKTFATRQEEKAGVKHTPGPWVICNGGKDIVGQCDHKGNAFFGGRYVAELCGWLEWNESERANNLFAAESNANARLIAAAPDLLAALKDCVESLKRLPDAEGAYRVTCIQQAERALEKALGAQERQTTNEDKGTK